MSFPRQTEIRWREGAVDALLAASAPPPSGRVLAVAIDRASLSAVGPWPWPHDTIAALVSRVSTAGPAAIGVDILLPQPASGEADRALADAVAAGRVALGFLMSDSVMAGRLVPAPIVVIGAPPHLLVWQAPGAVLPGRRLVRAAGGLGAISLEIGPDGAIHNVPLFVLAGGVALPGLAADLVRLSQGASAFLLDSVDNVVRVGDVDLPLGPDSRLRIRPTRPDKWATRTTSAADVLAGRVAPEQLRGRVVLIGATPPALGSFWRTAVSADTSSLQIEADAVETMLSGHVPYRPAWAWRAEACAALALAAIAMVAAVELAPLTALAAALTGCLLYAMGAASALLRWDVVIDPVTPPALGLMVAAASGLVTVSDARRFARRMRNRFEQHLSPAVVARIADRLDLPRLADERRDITALFTDLEGFTQAADRLDPATLVGLLNRYFEVVVGVVLEHGGTVDKIVGDGVHAIFNAPADLPDHPRRAVECALAIVSRTRDFARQPEICGHGLDRTRIGVETGPVVVGEIGGTTRLDYTAHGTAINTAARLEGLNKQLGSTICVGPVCRARVHAVSFRSLGIVEVRGRGPLALFEPLGAVPVSPEPTPALPPPGPVASV